MPPSALEAPCGIPVSELDRICERPYPWRDLAGTSILVTGASGFLGSWFCEALLRLNERGLHPRLKVTALCRDEYRARRRFARYAGRPDLSIVLQDFNSAACADLRADWFVHAASLATPAHYQSQPVETILPNVLGHWNLLECARRCRAAGYLFLSSSEIYGAALSGPDGLSEDQPGILDSLDPRSCYAESKRLGETLALGFWSEHQVPTRCVRLFHTYGPAMALGDGRIHSDLVADALAGRALRVHSDGSAKRSFSYAADAVAAGLLVLLRGASGEAYNAGSDEYCSIRDFALTLARIGGREVDFAPSAIRPGYLPSPHAERRPNLAKLRQLGWEPATTLAEGLQFTLRSFKTGIES